ncbi:MAG TPA: radical SAM family heme chaperone HemW [Gemmatimonadales bacterium]|jgi:oxygen-independent coproporphyrinogen-3 oxidase|nr:radical SAM family heme chaperone HemW [Gemmatimonadales bacterium]
MHLYLHVPFCARRCTYCDFAIAVRREVPSREYADLVLEEWNRWQDHPAWSAGPEIETIYLGGGTPSLLDPDQLGRVLDAIRATRPVTVGAEVTLEANPENVTAANAARWSALGVNRISLGGQSFDAAVLKWMHRTHDAEAVPRAVAVLGDAGLTNVSLDLIFALPEHLERDWARDLEFALALGSTHLSLYGLTVESHTPLARWVARGEEAEPPDETWAREFLLAHATLESAGFEHYEVSNFGRPGFRSQHNSAYWRRRPYLGLGPSAHSGFGPVRQWNQREYTAWARALQSGDDPVAGRESLDDSAVALETLYLGLRTREGVPRALVPEPTVGRWVREGWAVDDGERLALTPEGWLRLDALVGAVSARDPSLRSG